MIPVILVLLAAAIVIALFSFSKKEENQDGVGVVKGVLSKDAILVEFEGGRRSIVKFYGLKMACDAEMMDEKILDYLTQEVDGLRVTIRSQRVDTGDIVSAEVHTEGGEYLNATILEQGFARWNAAEAGSDARLTEAENMAFEGKVGIWNPAIQKIAKEKSEIVENASEVEETSEDKDA